MLLLTREVLVVCKFATFSNHILFLLIDARMANGKQELVGSVRVETPKTFTLGPLVSEVL